MPAFQAHLFLDLLSSDKCLLADLVDRYGILAVLRELRLHAIPAPEGLHLPITGLDLVHRVRLERLAAAIEDGLRIFGVKV